MSGNLRKINAEMLFQAILAAATGTIKAMTSTLQAAKTVAMITHDVLETLKENGIIVEKDVDSTPATNMREISAESKIAHMACQIIMTNLPEQAATMPEEPAKEGLDFLPKKKTKK